MSTQTEIKENDLITIVFREKKYILIFFILSIVCAIVFSSSWFIDPLFKSEVILYPPATNSNKMLIENDMRFGTDKEIDEHIQILKSGILRDSIIRKYKLINRYNIDNESKSEQLFKKIENRIIIDRTRYNAISIVVYDTNPDTAAMIANDMATIGDKVKEQILKNNLKGAFPVLEKQFKAIKHDLDSIEYEINKQTNAFVNKTSIQKKDYTEKLMDQIDVRQSLQKARSQKNWALLTLLSAYDAKLTAFNNIQEKYYEADQKLHDHFPSSYIITPAQPANKKAYPVRWLIIVLAGISSLLAGISILYFVEKTESVRKLFSNKE